jgi:hypothetical protein
MQLQNMSKSWSQSASLVRWVLCGDCVGCFLLENFLFVSLVMHYFRLKIVNFLWRIKYLCWRMFAHKYNTVVLL